MQTERERLSSLCVSSFGPHKVNVAPDTLRDPKRPVQVLCEARHRQTVRQSDRQTDG